MLLFFAGVLTSSSSLADIGLIGALFVVLTQGPREELLALSHRGLELHVAAVLAKLPGWKAEATRGSGDQGAK